MGPILLEGCDGGGKTTLAKFLANKFGLRRIKNGAPEPGEDLVQAYLKQVAPDTIIDRAWPSELIYAPLLKRRPLVSIHESAALFGELSQLGGRVIICLPPLATCERAWKDRPGELFQDRNILKAAWDGYSDLAFSFRGESKFLRLHDWRLDAGNAKLVKWLEEK